ncbi:hypothetical protein [Nocardioides mesophilus]|uniref:Uncharacterized protein n=1 Tax=Nocardioides mesophilus TaxID=433659 RepID=A0A7G9RA73_9ACTN|nr:hypothetical protein [Nocardioides mesophilus]QNN52498.1 hypothetical protein H9L09_18820 [Nocardioides mesophilus]
MRVCRTCGHALTDQERDAYVDQCGPCVWVKDEEEQPPRHRIRSHLALLDFGPSCYAPDCPACRWYRARGGWAHDDSMEGWLDGQR